VQGWVNKKLEGQATPRLFHHLDLGQLVMQIVPSNLLAAMWLQLAHAIAGNKQYRACRECGNWFEISSEDDGLTARREFCSDPCKSRDYRRRREQALALKAEGRTLQQIADKNRADPELLEVSIAGGHRGAYTTVVPQPRPRPDAFYFHHPW
jgi:hypothetical protein